MVWAFSKSAVWLKEFLCRQHPVFLTHSWCLVLLPQVAVPRAPLITVGGWKSNLLFLLTMANRERTQSELSKGTAESLLNSSVFICSSSPKRPLKKQLSDIYSIQNKGKGNSELKLTEIEKGLPLVSLSGQLVCTHELLKLSFRYMFQDVLVNVGQKEAATSMSRNSQLTNILLLAVMISQKPEKIIMIIIIKADPTCTSKSSL